MDELVRVIDAKGNVTAAEYDTVGQMVALDSLDAGRTESRFDLAGKLAVKETGKLRAAGQVVTYRYDFDRLRSLIYRDMPAVVYEYGAPGEGGDGSGNRAGRVKKVTMEGGTEERWYDKLGQVTETL